MHAYHDGLVAHLGRDETARKVLDRFCWPGGRAWVEQYVKGCTICQQNKNLTHKTKPPLYKITVPNDNPPFSQVAMDLITGLLKSRGHDSILTIVDHRCSRAAIFLPCQKTITGPQIAQLYYQHLYPWYGLPHWLISDRDPRFTSHFGRALAKELGISWNLSTAFHPQTDSLSERKNQWVEQFLRLLSANQHDWATMLPLATLVHNNAHNSTTGLAPNLLLHGLEPAATPDQTSNSDNPAARARVDQLRQRRKQAIAALNKTANSKSPAKNVFSHRQKVWLEARNLALPYGSVKLAPRRHGPFPITQVISPVTYKLALPHQWTIHPIFHASLLTPYSETKEHGENYSRPPPDLVGGGEQYEVEAIRSHRHQGRGKQLQYLVKWLGYPESDNTWEPAGHLQTPVLLKEYHRQNPVERIKGATTLDKKHPPSWQPPLPIRLGVTTLSTPRPPSGTFPLRRGTSTRLPSQLRQRKPSVEGPRRKPPPPSNTVTPTPPFAATPSASSIAKQCPETQTRPSTPQPRLTMSSTPSSEKTPPSPPTSPKSSTTAKSATSPSHPPIRRL